VFRENSQQVRANLKDYFVMFDLEISRTTSFGATEADRPRELGCHGDEKHAHLTLSDSFNRLAVRRIHRTLATAAETPPEGSAACSRRYHWTSRSSVQVIPRLELINRIQRLSPSTSKRTLTARRPIRATTCCGLCELRQMAALH
jgi:hypothetical protein